MNSTQKKTLPAPRVGGSTDIYAWTGAGAQGKGKIPASRYCAREFSGDPHKAFQTLATIETMCRSAPPGPKFSLPGEPDADKGMMILRNVRTCFIERGMEAIFQIALDDGTKFDALQTPGLLTMDIATKWTEALTVSGVTDGQGGTLSVCTHDHTNLAWAGGALLNLCTDSLRLFVEDSLAAHKKDHSGLYVLCYILKKNYRPSPEKVKKLEREVEAMDLRKFPGENVTLFVQAASLKLTEIKMNITMPNQCPTLLTSALKGLQKGTDTYFVGQVKNIALQSKLANTFSTAASSIPSTVQVEEKLDDLDELYQQLMENEAYDPGKSPPAPDAKFQALQAQVQQLQQARDASSTRGNAHGNNGGGHSTGGGSSNEGCYTCHDKTHIQRNCPIFRKEQNLKASGLSEAEWKELGATIKSKEESIKNWAHVSDDANLTISMNGKVVSKGCRHCKRYTRGTSMHSTLEHKGRNKVAYKPPDGAAAPAPAPAPSPSLSASLAQVPAAAPTSRVSFEDTADEPFSPGPMLRASPRTTYDFSNMPRSEPSAVAANMAAADSNSWWDIISGDYSSYLKE